jgi:hypothetical protein
MPIAKIILLTSEAEAPSLGNVLRRHNSALAVVPVHDAPGLRAACTGDLREARLLSFCTSVIVPAEILNGFPGPSYNFHPGPPERPGRYPAVFALYEGALRFGSTVHEMAAQVDSGVIVTAEWFDVPMGCDLVTLEELAFNSLIGVFRRLAPYMATVSRPLPRPMIPWGPRKTTKAQCDALCTLTPGLDPAEVERRRRACGAFLMEPRTLH